MRYIDSSTRHVDHTVAQWMSACVDSDVSEVRCQTGYFSFEGGSILLPALKKCADGNLISRFVVGSNRGVTLAEHVDLLRVALAMPRTEAKLAVAMFDTSLYHPKVYHFVLENGRKTAYVGSANLTGAGISGLNIEAGVILDTDDGDDEGLLDQISNSINKWFEPGALGVCLVANFDDIQKLMGRNLLASRRLISSTDPLEEGASRPKLAAPKNGAKLSPLFKMKWRGDVTELLPTDAVRFGSLSAQAIKKLRQRTEALYHYPQGVHLGHLFLLLDCFANKRAETPFDDKFIRLRGGLSEGRVGNFQRQIKYKMAAAIELGLVNDIRTVDDPKKYIPQISSNGLRLWRLIEPFLEVADFGMKETKDGIFSAKTARGADFFNGVTADALGQSSKLRRKFHQIFLSMPAVLQMLKYIYFMHRSAEIEKDEIYNEFFLFDPVVKFCSSVNIPLAGPSAAAHRCPFLLNILESCGIIDQSSSRITVKILALSPLLIATDEADIPAASQLIKTVVKEWKIGCPSLSEADKTSLRQAFGASFLTPGFHLTRVMEITV